MNIFYFNHDVKQNAAEHCTAHHRKMLVEYAQLLSTAHRILDGAPSIDLSGRRKKLVYTLPGEMNSIYLPTHANHPSAKWTRESSGNYQWLYDMFIALGEEYSHRSQSGRVHASIEKLAKLLKNPPKNIRQGEFTPPWRAMPDKYKRDKSVPDYCQASYRAYFNGEKQHIADWGCRPAPAWFVKEQDDANM